MLGTFPGEKRKTEGKRTLLEKFQMIAAAGFAGVELASHMDQSEVLAARDQTGLAVVSVACGAHTRSMSQANPAQRALAVEGLKQGLRDAKAYGASSVLCVPGGVNSETDYAAAYRRVREEISKAVPLAEELGVKIAIENVLNYFLISPLEAARLVDEFHSPAVGWQLDVGNILYVGWPDHWIRALGPRLQKLHFKEYSRKKATGSLREGFNVDYFAGDNHWRAIVQAIKEVNYAGWCIAEPGFHPEGVEPAERLRQVSAHLDRILAL